MESVRKPLGYENDSTEVCCLLFAWKISHTDIRVHEEWVKLSAWRFNLITMYFVYVHCDNIYLRLFYIQPLIHFFPTEPRGILFFVRKPKIFPSKPPWYSHRFELIMGLPDSYSLQFELSQNTPKLSELINVLNCCGFLLLHT